MRIPEITGAARKGRGRRYYRDSVCVAVLLAVGICVSGCNRSPENEFLSAVTGNDLDAVGRMLDVGGIDVNYRTSLTGATALGSACGLGHVEMARLLLARGADPNIVNSSGRTPLQMAAYDGSTAIVEMLIQAGANVDIADTEYGYTPLAAASRKGHADTVRVLINAGADLSIPTNTGRNPLQLALDGGYDDVVEMLVRHERTIQ